MQRHRFHTPPANISGDLVTLDADETHHLSRVLRLTAGARVFVFDGAGSEWECEVAQIGKQFAVLRIVAPLTDAVESPLHTTLAQALSKGDKFDLVVQKAVELGVTRIVPLMTMHGDNRRSEERGEQRLARWRRIALEAVKQCGRRRLVEIAEPLSWEVFSAGDRSDLKLIFAERGGQPLRRVKRAVDAARIVVKSISLAVAAEGGWSDAELRSADLYEFTPVQLGARILRTETAGIAAAALAQHLFGDLG